MGDCNCNAFDLHSAVTLECPDINDPTNGDISFDGTLNGRTTVGTVATYSCEEGYSLSSETTTRTCAGTGEWSGEDYTCESE